MKKVYIIDDSLANALDAFLKAEGIEIDLTEDDSSDLSIRVSRDHKECGLEILYAEGWIACGTALALARKLNISTRQVGAIMNHLKIKIKHCSLGCFE